MMWGIVEVECRTERPENAVLLVGNLGLRRRYDKLPKSEKLCTCCQTPFLVFAESPAEVRVRALDVKWCFRMVIFTPAC